jgi:hypothetical protein
MINILQASVSCSGEFRIGLEKELFKESLFAYAISISISIQPGGEWSFSETARFPFVEKVCRFCGMRGMVSSTWKSFDKNSKIAP